MTTINARLEGNVLVGGPLERMNLTTRFGVPRNNGVGYHTGIDGQSVASTSRLVRVVADGYPRWVGAWDGTSRDSRANGGYGNVVLVRHADGDETLYAHLSGFSKPIQDWIASGYRAAVRPQFREGDALGIEGNSGYVLGWNGTAWTLPPAGDLEHGRHLHFEFRDRSGSYVNPLARLRSAPPEGPESPPPLRSPELLQAMAVASLARAVHEQAGIAGARVVADQADRLVAMLED